MCVKEAVSLDGDAHGHPPQGHRRINRVRGLGVYLCAACSRIGRCRLGLINERFENGALTFDGRCGVGNEGQRGVAHGGWTAAVLDEACGHYFAWAERDESSDAEVAVTGTLRVKFHRPVPIERDLIVISRLGGRRGTRWYVKGEIRLVSSDALLATAVGIFVERGPSHFERTAEWLASQDADAARIAKPGD